MLESLSRFFQMNNTKDTTYEVLYLSDTTGVTHNHSDLMFVGVVREGCKNTLFMYLQKKYETKLPLISEHKVAAPIVERKRESLITVHGNVMYNLNYRSYVDTPYAADNVYQHTVQAYLDVTVKKKYPMRIYLNTHFSNTPLLRNFTNLNFQYNSSQFVNNVRNNLKNWAAEQLNKQVDIDKMKAQLDQKYNQLKGLQTWLNDPVNYQRIIEEREAEYVRAHKPNPAQFEKPELPAMDSNKIDLDITKPRTNPWAFLENKLASNEKIKNKEKELDSNKTVKSAQQEYDKKQKLYDSLSNDYSKAEAKYEKEKSLLTNKRDSIVATIQSVQNIDELRRRLHEADLPDSAMPKGYKYLLAIKSFGVGTMPINYSELSIKNINITGVQIEYNPSFYAAFASGFISYRFRNYFINNHERPKQYVTAVRFGKGQVDGNHVIFTWYTGKRYTYNYTISTNDTFNDQPRYTLMGFTIESRYQLDKNNSLIAEYGKSSIPYYSNRPDLNKLVANTFRFSDRSNEAYSIKLQSLLTQTQTKITATYRRLGTNFQSFSLFTNSATQNSWYVRVSQPFFKKKLTMDASLRQNDFYNPFVAQQYSSKAVFKSIQATLRIKKLPVISLGYFPSSQLIKLNEENYFENVFYTLVGTATHSYRTKNASMNTSLVYTQFYNKKNDSNFIYFNTKNIILNQSAYFSKYTLQGTASVASNHYYNLYMIGGGIDYKLGSWLTIGGGLKYNHQTAFNEDLIGYTLKTKIKVPQFGDVELFYDKGYIPGANRNLVNNEIGRIIYLKTF